MAERGTDCRRLLSTCRPLWTAGNGDGAWAALSEAEELADSEGLRVEVLAMRAGLHLLAEQLPDAVAAAREALERGECIPATAMEGETRRALLDSTVTLNSMCADGPHPAAGIELTDALRQLDAIAREPAVARTPVVGRAVSNSLNIRIWTLRDEPYSAQHQVDLWSWITEARTRLEGMDDQGTVLRQAVDVGRDGGQWDRAWAAAQELLGHETQRNERIAVLAKAALLAWEAARDPAARELGEQARALSVAVDHPWVRTYAYLAHVVASAASGRDLGPALRAYTACTTSAGHATRPNRAWVVAQIALDAGHRPERVDEFLSATLPGGLGPHDAWRQILLADARGEDVDAAVAQRLTEGDASAPNAARVHLAVARTYRRGGRPSAAVARLAEARRLLANWPGRLRERVEQEAASLERPVITTPAQHRVLVLLAEGQSNAEIGRALGLSERTVAVHVAAMLRANSVNSRTALAAQHLRLELG
ncbi:MAG: LuxR C-terminal-related transcriptional regulator [Actinomycetaceae bacterium]